MSDKAALSDTPARHGACSKSITATVVDKTHAPRPPAAHATAAPAGRRQAVTSTCGPPRAARPAPAGPLVELDITKLCLLPGLRECTILVDGASEAAHPPRAGGLRERGARSFTRERVTPRAPRGHGPRREQHASRRAARELISAALVARAARAGFRSPQGLLARRPKRPAPRSSARDRSCHLALSLSGPLHLAAMDAAAATEIAPAARPARRQAASGSRAARRARTSGAALRVRYDASGRTCPQAYSYAAARPLVSTDDDGLYPDGYPDPNQAADVASVADVLDTEGMRCLARCIEAVDPLGPGGDAGAAFFVPVPKSWAQDLLGVRVPRFAGAKRVTTWLSALSQKLGMGPGNSMRQAGRAGSVAAVVYGDFLVAAELACITECATQDKCE